MNLKDSIQSVHTIVQLKFGSVIGLCNREMESEPIPNPYLNIICSKQLATECKQTACESSLSDIFCCEGCYDSLFLFADIASSCSEDNKSNEIFYLCIFSAA